MKSSTQPLTPIVRDDKTSTGWSAWARPAPAQPIEILSLCELEVETCCAYCRGETETLVTCISCQRSLCARCRRGLCAKRQCMPRPQGDGVR